MTNITDYNTTLSIINALSEYEDGDKSINEIIVMMHRHLKEKNIAITYSFLKDVSNATERTNFFQEFDNEFGGWYTEHLEKVVEEYFAD